VLAGAGCSQLHTVSTVDRDQSNSHSLLQYISVSSDRPNAKSKSCRFENHCNESLQKQWHRDVSVIRILPLIKRCFTQRTLQAPSSSSSSSSSVQRPFQTQCRHRLCAFVPFICAGWTVSYFWSPKTGCGADFYRPDALPDAQEHRMHVTSYPAQDSAHTLQTLVFMRVKPRMQLWPHVTEYNTIA